MISSAIHLVLDTARYAFRSLLNRPFLRRFCRGSQQDIFNVMGALYATVLFLGFNNASTVQPVVAVERSVFYREKAAGLYHPLPFAAAQVRGHAERRIDRKNMGRRVCSYLRIEHRWFRSGFEELKRRLGVFEEGCLVCSHSCVASRRLNVSISGM